MSDQLFREKSLQKISSPEELNNYLKVANPGMWLLLIGVLVAFVGFFVWGVFGQIDVNVESLSTIKNNEATIYIKDADIGKLTEESFIKLDGNTYKLVSLQNAPIKVDESFDEYMLNLGNLQVGEWVYIAKANVDINDGTYLVKVTGESIKPISLLFN